MFQLTALNIAYGLRVAVYAWHKVRCRAIERRQNPFIFHNTNWIIITHGGMAVFKHLTFFEI